LVPRSLEPRGVEPPLRPGAKRGKSRESAQWFVFVLVPDVPEEVPDVPLVPVPVDPVPDVPEPVPLPVPVLPEPVPVVPEPVVPDPVVEPVPVVPVPVLPVSVVPVDPGCGLVVRSPEDVPVESPLRVQPV
jgi:hypothetical protein